MWLIPYRSTYSGSYPWRPTKPTKNSAQNRCNRRHSSRAPWRHGLLCGCYSVFTTHWSVKVSPATIVIGGHDLPNMCNSILQSSEASPQPVWQCNSAPDRNAGPPVTTIYSTKKKTLTASSRRCFHALINLECTMLLNVAKMYSCRHQLP